MPHLGKQSAKISAYLQQKTSPHLCSEVSVLLQAKSLVETVNTSTGVNQLLLAGIERVALGAEFNLDVLLGRASGKDVTASTTNGSLFVVGVDTFLHIVHLFLIS